MADNTNEVNCTTAGTVVQAHNIYGSMHFHAQTNEIDVLTDDLATAIQRQWEAEERVRRVHDPFPIPIRWRTCTELSTRWEAIHGAPDRHEPIQLDSRDSRVDEITEVFTRVPSGRLVVLGDAGAGKSILSSRFALTVLRNRTTACGAPVPVILPVGTWDPSVTSFRGWAAAQLITNHPMLAAAAESGGSMARRLVDSGRIVFVLDGFDEIAEGYRASAIRLINADLQSGRRMLLTSRPDQYASAVQEAGVLSRAAVVRLDELTVEDLAAYLPNTIRKPGTHDRNTKWHPVLDRLQTTHHDPAVDAVATVLRTPLMVALARTIYSDTHADPNELFVQRTGDLDQRVRELEGRLLAGFVPAVYLDAPPDVQLAGARHWRREDAVRWLRFLATTTTRQGTGNIEWWQLIKTIKRLTVGLIVGLIGALVVAIFSSLMWAFADFPRYMREAWFLTTTGVGLVCGAGSGVVVSLGLRRSLAPSRAGIKVQGRSRDVARHVRRAFYDRTGIAWLLVWMLAGAAIGMINRAAGAVLGLGAGVAVGIGIWLVGAVAAALSTPVPLTQTVSPRALLSLDRRTTVQQGIVFGFGSATVTWFVVWVGFEPAYGLPVADVLGNAVWQGWLTMGLCGVFSWILLATLWGPWIVARFWLACTRKLPLHLMSFLDDAHRLGVLRQSGGVYQFRHARLQAHLVENER